MAENVNPTPEVEEGDIDLMTLQDEEGNEVTFEVLDALDYQGVHYLAAAEYTEEETDDDAQMIILRVGEDEEGEFLDVVDDDELLLALFPLFEQRLSDRFDLKQ